MDHLDSEDGFRASVEELEDDLVAAGEGLELDSVLISR
jgi:hypothetical protein